MVLIILVLYNLLSIRTLDAFDDLSAHNISYFNNKTPSVIILDGTNKSAQIPLSAINNFFNSLTHFINLYCNLPDLCDTAYPQTLNLSINNVIWQTFPIGPYKKYIRFEVIAANNSIPIRAIQMILSRNSDVLESIIGCKIILPQKSFYTFAFWVLPIVAGFIFFLVLASVVLIYHLWNPTFGNKIMAKYLGRDEGTSLIVTTSPTESTNVIPSEMKIAA